MQYERAAVEPPEVRPLKLSPCFCQGSPVALAEGARVRGPEEDQQLDAFLTRPSRNDAHLRPGIAVQRAWPWADAVNLDERGALASEVRAAITEQLTDLSPAAAARVRRRPPADVPWPPGHPEFNR
jgi:hypothetical protein